MGEIRGEKVRFSKKDIVPLHDLPSARAEDPLIVHCPPRSTWLGRIARFTFGLFLLAAVLSGGFFVVIESGALDATFANGAQRVLNNALAPQYRAEISGTAVRFSREWKLAVEARDVTVHRESDGLIAAETEAVRLVIDPIALLSGRFSVSEIEADGVSVDESLFSSGPPLDFAKLRVDAVPTLLEAAFTQLDLVQGFISKGGLDRMRIEGLEIAMGKARARPVLLSVRNLAMERGIDASLTIAGTLAINGYESPISAKAVNAEGQTRSFSAWIGDVRLTPFLLRRDSRGDPRQGYDGSAEVTISARRGTGTEKPAVSTIAQTHRGTFYQDGNPQEVTRGTLNFAYDFSKDTIEVASSRIDFGPMVMPISGGLIDLDRLPGNEAAGAGIGIDLLVDEGLASVPSAGEQPFPFSFKIFGRFLYDSDELQLDTLSVSTPMGQMTGSLRARFFEGEGPEVSFGARFANMQTTVIKQLWPYWIADKPRRWVLANIFGGTVTEGSAQVFIPKGRMSVEPRPLHLDENELRISFDVVNARMNVTGDIPPLRDTDAHFELVGPKVTTTIKTATSYFPSGRSVKVESGELVLDDVYTKPLMADLSIAVAGSADSVAELVSFRPINALKRIGFEASDFKGTVKGTAEVRLGLISEQNPPDPVWKAHLDLAGVDLAKPFSGRKIDNLNAALDVDPKAARLKGKADIDGVSMELAVAEPVEEDPQFHRERQVKVVLDGSNIGRFAPGLDRIVNGSVTVQLDRLDEKRQAVTADLTRATLTVPWLGWTKGAGIPAKAKLEVTEGEKQSAIDKFVLDGDGFGLSGSMIVDKNGLVSADLARVRLSPSDDYSVVLRQAKGGYQVAVNGKSADVRSLIDQMKSPGDGGDGDAGSDPNIRIDAQLDRMVGFGDEALSNVTLDYASRGGKLSGLDFSAVTRNGQAIVGQMRRPSELGEVSVTSGDAGTVARFANLYSRMNGGLLNLKMKENANGVWNGSVDLRNFSLDNEQRLQSIVSTPAGADGRSLNKAVKRDIDVSSARFQRGFARLIYSDQTLRIENGVVRGEQVGATFQGLVRDSQGRMDLTGTFMPAYGLNRLFAELPVIGILLGNGRDRGLLGITFKLTGATEQPKLVVNPLSIIAPGVFRQIFEFR